MARRLGAWPKKPKKSTALTAAVRSRGGKIGGSVQSAETNSKTTQTIEQHPWFHDWVVHHDSVEETNSRNIPIVIKREFHCNYCPHLRFWRINVIKWEVVRKSYKYIRGVEIIRVTKESFLKKEFLSTTDLPQDVLDKIAA